MYLATNNELTKGILELNSLKFMQYIRKKTYYFKKNMHITHNIAF